MTAQSPSRNAMHNATDHNQLKESYTMRIAFTLLTTLLFVLGQINVYAQRKFELGDLDKLYTIIFPFH